MDHVRALALHIDDQEKEIKQLREELNKKRDASPQRKKHNPELSSRPLDKKDQILTAVFGKDTQVYYWFDGKVREPGQLHSDKTHGPFIPKSFQCILNIEYESYLVFAMRCVIYQDWTANPGEITFGDIRLSRCESEGSQWVNRNFDSLDVFNREVGIFLYWRNHGFEMSEKFRQWGVDGLYLPKYNHVLEN